MDSQDEITKPIGEHGRSNHDRRSKAGDASDDPGGLSHWNQFSKLPVRLANRNCAIPQLLQTQSLGEITLEVRAFGFCKMCVIHASRSKDCNHKSKTQTDESELFAAVNARGSFERERNTR